MFSILTKTIILTAAFFLTSIFAVGQKIQGPIIQAEHYSIEQGLSDRMVNAITKDRLGFLWVATANGLNRFDGYDFLGYNSSPRNPHKIQLNKIYSLLRDRLGNLLIIYNYDLYFNIDLLNTLSGKVTKLDLQKDAGFQHEYRNFFQAADGTIYFHTIQKGKVVIYQWDEKTSSLLKIYASVHKEVDFGCFVSFLKAGDGTFWFVYNWEAKPLQILHTDADGSIIKSYGPEDLSLTNAETKGFIAITENSPGDILLTLYSRGVFVMKKNEDVFKPHPQLPHTGYYFTADKLGNLLAYQTSPTDTANACFLLTRDNQLINYSWVYRHQNQITTVFSDDFTRGFIAGYSNGFNTYYLRPQWFKTVLDKSLDNTPYGISIRGIAKAGKNSIFIGTEGDGLYELDPEKNTLSRPGDRFTRLAILNDLKWTKALLAQGDSLLWISCLGGVVKYNIIHDSAQFLYTSGINFKGGSDEVWGISLDKNQTLWAVTRDGRLLSFNSITGTFTQYHNSNGTNPLESTLPSYLLISRDGFIWVGTTQAGLIRIDPVKKTSQRFTANEGDPSGFNSNQVNCIYEDDAGLLWVATMEAGVHVFDPVKSTVTAIYSKDNGLLNNSTVGVLPDDKGNFWVSTYNGLSYLDTKLKTSVNFTFADGLSHNEFNRFSFFRDPDNKRFYFGGMNGVNIFDEDKMQTEGNHAPLLIANMSVAGKDSSFIVKQEGLVNHVNIILGPDNRSLQLSLALASYLNSSRNQFSYKIEGYDKNWNYLGYNHNLRIDNLPVGNYNIILRGADSQGNWSSRHVILAIEVKEFWYKRWWALLLYALLFATAGYYFYRFQVNRKLAERETHRLLQLDAFKSRFFTNISHEFRTPITVILGMVELLKKYFREGVEPSHEQAADIIKRNGRQLLTLVTQLMDLSRLQSGKLELNLSNGDMISFLRYQLESYQSYAQTRQLDLHFSSEVSELPMAFDHEKVQTIFVNLISNAVKFTPGGGQVSVGCSISLSADNLPEFVIIEVTDTGTGIPADKLKLIFERFYQLDDSRKSEGSGIGLSLTQEIIKLMSGSISVKSELGTGTSFSISLPYLSPQTQLTSSDNIHVNDTNLAMDMPEVEDAGEQEQLPLLLIVEDNADVRFYIKACVKGIFGVVTSEDGSDGIKKATELVPDIIISDVMMPVKDGFELCESLKNNELTSHIPIVLLTARADFESRIAGLNRGADDYLAKPFEPVELLARLDNLVKLRRRLQQRYSSLSLLPVPPGDPAVELEDAFLLKIKHIVEEHMSDSDLQMSQLERKLGMSRSQVFRKVKAVTGNSPSVFIRSIRLQKARELLRHDDLSIAEIAYQVGFSTPAYFSTTFSEEFGKTPSEWRKS